MASRPWPEVDATTKRKLLGLVGLGLRSRGAVVGVQQVRAYALKGKLYFAVVAPDAAENSRDKVLPLLPARRIPFGEGPTASEMGAAAGRETTAAIGIVDRQ